jgi:hypothetical protein
LAKKRGLFCFDHTHFERSDIVPTAFYRAVPAGMLFRCLLEAASVGGLFLLTPAE